MTRRPTEGDDSRRPTARRPTARPTTARRAMEGCDAKPADAKPGRCSKAADRQGAGDYCRVSSPATRAGDLLSRCCRRWSSRGCHMGMLARLLIMPMWCLRLLLLFANIPGSVEKTTEIASLFLSQYARTRGSCRPAAPGKYKGRRRSIRSCLHGDVIAGLASCSCSSRSSALGIQGVRPADVGLAALGCCWRRAGKLTIRSWRRRRTRSARRWPLSAMAPHDDQRARPGSRRSVR